MTTGRGVIWNVDCIINNLVVVRGDRAGGVIDGNPVDDSRIDASRGKGVIIANKAVWFNSDLIIKVFGGIGRVNDGDATSVSATGFERETPAHGLDCEKLFGHIIIIPERWLGWGKSVG